MADRLESHLSFVLKESHAFYTLDHLVRLYHKHDVDPLLKEIVAIEVTAWKKQRNIAAHELMKIEEGTDLPWSARIALTEAPAKSGLILLRKIDNRASALRKRNMRQARRSIRT